MSYCLNLQVKSNILKINKFFRKVLITHVSSDVTMQLYLFFFCLCRELQVICLLLSPWKSEILSQSFRGWRPQWRTLLFSWLWRWMLPSACIKKGAVNDPSSHGHTVTFREMAPAQIWNLFFPSFLLFWFVFFNMCQLHTAFFTDCCVIHLPHVKRFCNLINAQIEITSMNACKQWHSFSFPIFFVVDDKLLCFCFRW